MASLVLCPARRVTALRQGQDVFHLNRCGEFFQTHPVSFMTQVKPFSPAHLLRQPPASHTVRPYFRRCTPLHNGSVSSDRGVTLPHSSQRRRLSGLACTRQSPISSVDVDSAPQFTSSSSVPAPSRVASISSAAAAFCPAATTPYTFFTPALRSAVYASMSHLPVNTVVGICEAPVADSGSRNLGALRGTAFSEACVPLPPYFSSFDAPPTSPYLFSPYCCNTTARAFSSKRRGYATSSGRPSNTDNNSSDDGASHSTTNEGSSHDNANDSENSKNNKVSKSTTWLEVERMRPRAPNPWDGTYQWPAAAPDPLEIRRESFHAFMHGKQELFSRELKVFVYGWAMAGLLIGLTALTIYVMAPDDFEWVEEERARMERAKRKKAAADPPSFNISEIDDSQEMPGLASKPSVQRRKED